MIVAAIIAVCVVLAVLGFLLPRLSIWPQRGVDRTLGAGERAGCSAPGRLGRCLRKQFSTSRRAADATAGARRRARPKLPI